MSKSRYRIELEDTPVGQRSPVTPARRLAQGLKDLLRRQGFKVVMVCELKGATEDGGPPVALQEASAEVL